METKEGREEFVPSNSNTLAITLKSLKVDMARNIEYHCHSTHPNIFTTLAIIIVKKRA